jgi:hypothetical protein
LLDFRGSSCSGLGAQAGLALFVMVPRIEAQLLKIKNNNVIPKVGAKRALSSARKPT